jgi:nitrogen fixation/metabolism regulation signal transduction histidine kinase
MSVVNISEHKGKPEYAINEAHWRAAANENMAYKDDFPECILTLPEAYDGAISHGKATVVKTSINLTSSGIGELIIEDNGVGFKTTPNDLIVPLTTTKQRGSGLGLSIVSKILHEHGGDLNFIEKSNGAKIKLSIKIN